MARKKLSLEALLELKDNFTAKITRAERKMMIFHRNMQRALPGMGKMFTGAMAGMNRQINSFAKWGAIGAGGVLALGIKAATDEYISFDNSIRQAGAKFKDLDVRSKDYEKTLKKIGKASREVAAITEFTATNTADALDKMAMAGFTSELAMSLLSGTSDLATAAGTDLATAVGIAADTLGAFGLMSDDVGKTTTGLTRIADVFAKTVNTANTDLLGLYEAAKSGAPAFTQAGQSMETFAAMVGTMANSGVKGEESGTQIRNMMLRLADQTPEATKVLRKLGVTTRDGAGNFRDMFDILQDFEKGLKGYGTAQKTAALATVFGARAVTGISIMLKEGSEGLRKYRAQLEGAGGAAKRMADAIRKSLGNQIEVVKSGLVELGLKFVEAFETRGSAALAKLTDKIQKFDINPVIEGADKAINGAMSFFGFLQDNWKALLWIVAATKGWALAQASVNALATLTGVSMAGVLGPLTAVLGIFAAWVIFNKEIQEFFTWLDGIAGSVGKFLDKFSLFGRTNPGQGYDMMGETDANGVPIYRNSGTATSESIYSKLEKQVHDVQIHAPQGYRVSQNGQRLVPVLTVTAGGKQ